MGTKSRKLLQEEVLESENGKFCSELSAKAAGLGGRLRAERLTGLSRGHLSHVCVYMEHLTACTNSSLTIYYLLQSWYVE